MSDPAKYRTKKEVDGYKSGNDPILNMRQELVSNKICTEAELSDIDTRVKKVVKESAEFAQTSPEPDASELYTDVLIEDESHA